MPPRKRIVSLLPAATELASALGLEDDIVGISFECDYPQSITDRPRVVSTLIDTQGMSLRDIDDAVSERVGAGKGLYIIDEFKLKELRPDIILTQDLCQVCAPSGNELSQALAMLDYQPEVIFMSPHTLRDIEDNLLQLAAATGTTERAQKIINAWRMRIAAVKNRTVIPLRVTVLEWVDPLYCAGHWLAEMIEIAGGDDAFARKGKDSVRLEWNDVLAYNPQVLVIAPCGFNRQQAQEQLACLGRMPHWDRLSAVESGRVHAVDGNAYFVRPGPRVIDGLEILADLFGGVAEAKFALEETIAG